MTDTQPVNPTHVLTVDAINRMQAPPAAGTELENLHLEQSSPT